jgi:hypothetical protein
MNLKTVLIATIIACTGLSCATAFAAPSEAAAAVRTEPWTAFEGVYELAPSFKVKVWTEAGHLMAQATGQGAFELFAEAGDTYFAKVAPLKFEFKRDASGKVSQFTLLQGGQEQVARKVN